MFVLNVFCHTRVTVAAGHGGCSQRVKRRLVSSANRHRTVRRLC